MLRDLKIHCKTQILVAATRSSCYISANALLFGLIMLRYLFLVLLTAAFFVISPYVSAGNYDVTNLQVTAQAENAVKARDVAMAQAQRQAFAILIGQPLDKVTSISDDQIARLISNFSVQGERMAARSYTARFTFRFDPNRTQMFIQSHGFDLADPQTLNAGSVVTAQREIMETAYTPKAIIILPILDIGARRVLWDEPNPWRDIWQRTDHSDKALHVRVPIGDVSDIADVPDATFLNDQNNSTMNAADMLARYSAEELYVAVIKNQGAALDTASGMVLSLYRHDGDQLHFIRKTLLKARPGHAFDDAVPATLKIIAKRGGDQEEGVDETVKSETSPVLPLAAPGTPMSVTVPYQSLGQWVSIQRRLRRVTGVASVVPMRVSPSSANVRLVPSVGMDELSESLRNNGFQLQTIPGGETVLLSQ